MTMDHTIYRKSDGCILQSGWGRPAPLDGFDWIAGQYDGATHYVAEDGTPQELPPSPGLWASFNRQTGQWEDRRSSSDREIELAAARSVTSLTKLQFCERCMELGILDPTGAAAAARGDIPERFQPMVDSLTPMEKDSLMVRWPGSNQVNRLDPFIVKLGGIAGFPDELLDVLFLVPEID